MYLNIRRRVILNFDVLGRINCYNFREIVCGVIVSKYDFYFFVYRNFRVYYFIDINI